MAMMPEHVRARLDARNRPKEPRTPGREPPPKAPGTPGRSLPPKAPGTPSNEPPPSRGAAQQQREVALRRFSGFGARDAHGMRRHAPRQRGAATSRSFSGLAATGVPNIREKTSC